MKTTEKMSEDIIPISPHSPKNQEEEIDTDNHNDPRWGNLKPMQATFFGCKLYSCPQFQMLIGTFLLTILLEGVVLKFVFFGVHFYIGSILCLYILYLLFSLGFSNPGIAFLHYQRLQSHLDLEICNQKCRHAVSLNQEFAYFCNKCNIPTTSTTRHCNVCNCCIVDYDHHCVFIGKCVGSKNYSQFKQFLCLIFSTLIYGLISGLLTASQIQKLKSQ